MTATLRAAVALIVTLILSLTAATAQDYAIGTGDRLVIEVLEDPSLNRTVEVLPGGTINFPYIGSQRVAGASPSQVESTIRTALESTLAAAPTVFVTVIPRQPDPVVRAPAAPPVPEEDPVITVFLMGEVAAPGPKPMPPGTTFLQGLSLGGGLTQFAATRRIQLRRPSNPPQLVVINYDALMRGAVLTNDLILADGDVILVPERKLFE